MLLPLPLVMVLVLVPLVVLLPLSLRDTLMDQPMLFLRVLHRLDILVHLYLHLPPMLLL
uniref:NADH dehydrogenase subunit 4 n=1 Tax=Picea glauca TaxID=3330 RepID=A0A101M2X0_PICGL|nr:hypothetical protein ABT39_MTgene3141 [Picea glauca]QHR86439.1 hypothetical protein Q903MT_gene438 [Picea sitchensis]